MSEMLCCCCFNNTNTHKHTCASPPPPTTSSFKPTYSLTYCSLGNIINAKNLSFTYTQSPPTSMQLNPGTKLAKSETVQNFFGSAAPKLGFSMTYFVSLMNLLPEFHAHVNKNQSVLRSLFYLSSFGVVLELPSSAFSDFGRSFDS